MNKKLLLGAGGVLLVALLAGAAFMAVRLLNARLAGTAPASLAASSGGPNGGGPKPGLSIQMDRSPDLPARGADMSGQVTAIDGNSLTVASLAKGVTDPTGAPTVEVVLTRDTTIYRDTTAEDVSNLR